MKLVLASEKYVKKTMLDAPKIAARAERLTGRTQSPDLFQLARNLLSMFDTLRARNIGPALAIATDVLRRELIPCFVEILGVNAWDLSPSQMSAIYNGGSSPTDFQIFDSWYTRTIPKTL
jgi:hypothetical protein